MFNRKITVKNKRNQSEKLTLTFDEFKVKFQKELKTAIETFKKNEENKQAFLPKIIQKSITEQDFYLNLRFNFNNNSRSNWYIERII